MSSSLQARKRVCLLTGAGGFLGNAFCSRFARDYEIVAVYRNKPPSVPSQRQWYVDPLQPRAHLSENENPVFAVQADLTDDKQIERIIELTLTRYGHVDLLINNAVHSVWGSMIDDLRLQKSMERQFKTNIVAPLMLAVTLARQSWRNHTKENKAFNRNVVNISSTAGLYIYPNFGQSVYSASKAALNYLTYHMADEFASCGIRINALAPTSFPDLVPIERVLDSIVALDHGDMTGKIHVLHAEHEEWI